MYKLTLDKYTKKTGVLYHLAEILVVALLFLVGIAIMSLN